MVEGWVDFGSEPVRFDAADLLVTVEDTTYADEAAVPLFRWRFAGVSYAGEPEGLLFRLDYNPKRTAGRTCTLSVLVDLDGDGRPGRGDYISYESVRVPKPGAIARVRVGRIG